MPAAKFNPNGEHWERVRSQKVAKGRIKTPENDWISFSGQFYIHKKNERPSFDTTRISHSRVMKIEKTDKQRTRIAERDKVKLVERTVSIICFIGQCLREDAYWIKQK